MAAILRSEEVAEVIEKHALDRYGLTELVTDKETLEKLEPNMELLKTLLTFRGHLQGEVLQTARRFIRQVVEEIKRNLGPGQCYSYRMLPILGGSYKPDGRILLPISEHFGVCGSLHHQMKDVPDGELIRIKQVD